jgi:hypothetical protein
MIDGPSRPEELGHELARLVVSKDDSMFAYTQTPKSRKFSSQGGYVAFLSSIYLVEGPAHVLSHAGMQCPEGIDDLIRELQAGISSELR